VPLVATININGLPEAEYEAQEFESKATETCGEAVDGGKRLTRRTDS
jgi:hypothetical protein